MDTIGARVKALRESKRLNQSELARRVGIKQPSLYNIESNNTKSIKGYVLDALARELNTTTGYILTGAENSQDHEASMMLAEIQAIFRALSSEDKEKLLRDARGLALTAKSPASHVNPFPQVSALEN
jgi:transcriptional regulator with XRE-family HTH domain